MVDYSKYVSFKKQALEEEPIMVQRRVQDIQLISDDQLVMNDSENGPVRLFYGKNVLKSFADLSGVNSQIVENIGKIQGPKAMNEFLATMQSVMSSTGKDSNAWLVIDPKSQTVTNVRKNLKSVSRGTFFKMFEDFMDKNSDFMVKSLNFSGDDVQIAAVNPNWSFGKISDEKQVFNSGYFWQNGISSTGVSPYVERLFCKNGLTSFRKDSKFGIYLRDNTAKAIQTFFDGTMKLDNPEQMQQAFVQNIHRMTTTPASLSEMEKARAVVLSNSWAKGEENIQRQLEAHFPIIPTLQAYLKGGANLHLMDQASKSLAKTNVPLWDVINSMTWLASHDSPLLCQENGLNIEMAAGEMAFKEKFDCEFQLPTPIWEGNENFKKGSLLN